jgi:tRNA A37 threonylcarbamoyladenosine synthetase subunit TsaC/SUA5/YrdC
MTLLERLLPGPVTLCFERSSTLTEQLNPGVSLIGIRIPKNNFIMDIAHQCGQAIALTSANISSHQSPLCIEDFKELHPNLSRIFDSGTISNSNEGSTVVDLSHTNYYRIIRNGR